jgi:YD repeat-containing protein
MSPAPPYDALGRPTKILDGSGGTVQYQYIGNDVLQSVSGSQTFKKQFEYDGLGRLTSVCEITAGTTTWPGGTCAQSTNATGYWTKYTYDVLNNLLTVTQNAQSWQMALLTP